MSLVPVLNAANKPVPSTCRCFIFSDMFDSHLLHRVLCPALKSLGGVTTSSSSEPSDSPKTTHSSSTSPSSASPPSEVPEFLMVDIDVSMFGVWCLSVGWYVMMCVAIVSPPQHQHHQPDYHLAPQNLARNLRSSPTWFQGRSRLFIEHDTQSLFVQSILFLSIDDFRTSYRKIGVPSDLLIQRKPITLLEKILKANLPSHACSSHVHHSANISLHKSIELLRVNGGCHALLAMRRALFIILLVTLNQYPIDPCLGLFRSWTWCSFSKWVTRRSTFIGWSSF